MNHNFYANLDDLNLALENILTGVTASTANAEVLRRAFSDTILDAMSNSDIDWSQVDMYAFVEDTLRQYTGVMFPELQADVAKRVQESVARTAAFYQSIGLDLSLDDLNVLAARSQMAQDLGQHFADSYGSINRKLRDSTVGVMQEAIGLGRIDLNYIRNEILRRSVTSEHHASTQAQTSVAAFNQHYRNTIAEQADLHYFMYSGSVIAGTRPFCRAHLDNVYHEDVIAKMSNGQLNPVQVFKGGYNCRHSWLAVDPDWLDDDTKVFHEDSPVTPVDDGRQKNPISVGGSAAHVARLSRQIELEKQGYVRFWDDPNSESGFTYADQSYVDALGSLPPGEIKKLNREFGTATAAAALGNEVGLNFDLNKASNTGSGGIGDFDIIFNGVLTQVKTKTSTSRYAITSHLTTGQANQFLVHLTKAVSEENIERARGSARSWVKARPGYRILVLHGYEDEPYIEEF